MKLFVTYNYEKTFKTFLKEKLDQLGIVYQLVNSNEIVFDNTISAVEKKKLSSMLETYSVEITNDQNLALVDRIKSTIHELLNSEDICMYNTSDYLADKLNYSYSYLSNLFSESTFISIESYIILCKINKAKELLVNTNLTLTEIAFKLNYSSVAHLSRQFKKNTGLTPSSFQSIITKRKLQH